MYEEIQNLVSNYKELLIIIFISNNKNKNRVKGVFDTKYQMVCFIFISL